MWHCVPEKPVWKNIHCTCNHAWKKQLSKIKFWPCRDDLIKINNWLKENIFLILPEIIHCTSFFQIFSFMTCTYNWHCFIVNAKYLSTLPWYSLFFSVEYMLLTDTSNKRWADRAATTFKDTDHPAHSLSTMLPSGNRLRSIRCCRTSRCLKSFFPLGCKRPELDSAALPHFLLTNVADSGSI